MPLLTSHSTEGILVSAHFLDLANTRGGVGGALSQILLYSACSEIFSHFVFMITITVAEMCSFDPCLDITVLVIYLPHLTHFDDLGWWWGVILPWTCHTENK